MSVLAAIEIDMYLHPRSRQSNPPLLSKGRQKTKQLESLPLRQLRIPRRMANIEYLICSFCQGPSSRQLRHKLQPHFSNPSCRIRESDLDWLDRWRVLLPTHVEWDLQRLRDDALQSEYERELPKTNVVSTVQWVPSIEGRLSASPEWDDLDGWRTIEFQTFTPPNASEQAAFGHLFTNPSLGVIQKRMLHAYNDDVEVVRLPFHSECLRILYECCNEVTYSTYATSTVSDVIASILLPSWREGDVSMDWVPPTRRMDMGKKRLISPWAEKWDPLDPETNVPPSLVKQASCSERC